MGATVILMGIPSKTRGKGSDIFKQGFDQQRHWCDMDRGSFPGAQRDLRELEVNEPEFC